MSVIVAARDEMHRAFRRTLSDLGYREVVTPVLSSYADIAPIVQFEARHPTLCGRAYLRIAPTEHLKRIVADGPSRIYEIAANFRPDGLDHTHLPEFSSLEAMSRDANVEQMQDLAERLIGCGMAAVREWFNEEERSKHLDTRKAVFVPSEHGKVYELSSPIRRISLPEYLATQWGFRADDFFDEQSVRRLYTQLGAGATPATVPDMMDGVVQRVAQTNDSAVFIGDYPKYLGGPAHPCSWDIRFKERCELFLGPLELANMSSTLTKYEDVLEWYSTTAASKQNGGTTSAEIDAPLMEAARKGFPQSAVLGIGVDRLLMVALSMNQISEVRPFARGQPFSASKHM